MPTINATDITVVLSGGTNNIDPNSSLGGVSSANIVQSGVLNNLFNDVTAEQSTEGIQDYRCIYVFNDGAGIMYDVSVWITDTNTTGASMMLGIQNLNEQQNITISGVAATGGYVEFNYNGTPFQTTYNSDLGAWAISLRDTLLNLLDGDSNNYFNSVTVLAQYVGSSTIIFNIAFNGIDSSRSFDDFIITNNQLEPSGVDVAATVVQIGSPINTTAPTIVTETTPPGGVTFLNPTITSPIVLPVLRPNDGFPIWVQRTIVAGTSALSNDGFTMTVSASSV